MREMQCVTVTAAAASPVLRLQRAGSNSNDRLAKRRQQATASGSSCSISSCSCRGSVCFTGSFSLRLLPGTYWGVESEQRVEEEGDGLWERGEGDAVAERSVGGEDGVIEVGVRQGTKLTREVYGWESTIRPWSRLS